MRSVFFFCKTIDCTSAKKPPRPDSRSLFLHVFSLCPCPVPMPFAKKICCLRERKNVWVCDSMPPTVPCCSIKKRGARCLPYAGRDGVARGGERKKSYALLVYVRPMLLLRCRFRFLPCVFGVLFVRDTRVCFERSECGCACVGVCIIRSQPAALGKFQKRCFLPFEFRRDIRIRRR